jgi:serine phosphatase RsbU (regulator of sigma subunit)
MFHEFSFSGTRVHLDAGDTLFLYTDGLSEASRGEDEYGVERVTNLMRQQATRKPAEVISACLDDLRGFVDGPAVDDLTLLAIQRAGQSPAARPRDVRPL